MSDELGTELRALVERLARMVRADVEVDATTIVLLRNDVEFARARGTSTLELRLAASPGALTLGPGHADGWWLIDPWPQDLTFRRGPDQLRDAFERAASATTDDSV